MHPERLLGVFFREPLEDRSPLKNFRGVLEQQSVKALQHAKSRHGLS